MKRVKLKKAKMPKLANRGKGSNALIFDEEQRTMVMMLAGHGMTLEQIVKFVNNPNTGLPIDISTLSDHFTLELATGKLHTDLNVSRALVAKATGRVPVLVRTVDGEGATVSSTMEDMGKEPDTTAIIWYEKTRRGFKEGMLLEHTGKDGAELPTVNQTVVILPQNGRETPGVTYGSLPMKDVTPPKPKSHLPEKGEPIIKTNGTKSPGREAN